MAGFFATLVPLLGVLVSAPASAEQMVAIPAGEYRPQYSPDAKPVSVQGFQLDRYAVTNAEFLGFVTDQPKWQRHNVPPLFADEAYLSHWAGELTLGELAPPASPVTNVSWFAARAYCAAQEKRLPTMDEWEFAARAGRTGPEPQDRKAFDRLILDWYAKPTRLPLPPVGYSFKNHWGVWDMHGLVWEWVSDFNALMNTGGSRKDAGGLDRQLFCAAGSVGSTDPSDYAAFLRYAMRSSVKAHYAMQNMGFRCARDVSINDSKQAM